MKTCQILIVAALALVASQSFAQSLAQPTARIVGGNPVTPGQYPFIAAVYFDKDGDGIFNQSCGGTLIGKNWILTAAHCVVNRGTGALLSPAKTAALLGTVNLDDSTPLQKIQRIIAHPNYIPEIFLNDIALLQLTESYNGTRIKLPAPFSGVPEINESSIVAGWGAIAEVGSSGTTRLQEVSLPVISHEDCLPIYSTSLQADANVCAGGSAVGERDSCQGDSGGPLFVARGDEFVQAGIVSYGEGCARPNIPGVYTRLTSYTEWINTFVDDTDIYTGDADTSVSQPENLQALIYSDVSIELFWDRSTSGNGIAGYEVKRDLTIVETRDASSYFTDNLEPGTSYRWMVTAIDNNGNRSTPTSLSVTTTGEPQTNAEGPAVPTGFRVLRYSSTAAELFWDRATTPFLRYDIFRNSVLLDTTNGTSYFMTDLEKDGNYLFELIAIDTDDQRSESVSTNLGNPDERPVAELPTPTGLRISRYSSSAAELFWDRSDIPLLTYEVYRNNVRLGTSEGTSFFVSDLQLGGIYQFNIIAVDSDGGRSDSVSTNL